MYIWIALLVISAIALTGYLFLNSPRFGRLPRGERLERIKQSPHYKDGEFRNMHHTVMMTSDKRRLQIIWEFLFRKIGELRPDKPLLVIKTNLKEISRDKDMLVWFGHSSYLIHTDGKRILVDPVFRTAAPVSFVNRPFKGTDVYKPEDMPDIDYLVITHDHWDHLDYQTVTELKDRTEKVICGLGVGEHLEYWGFGKGQIIELDWFEDAPADKGFTIHCLPSRHFSGRGLSPNRTLWASFLIETPSQKIYIGGDGGYDTHYKETGEKFPDIDLAILENGQYDEGWKYIHLMPRYLAQAARDLKAKRIITVHHSKYALAKHRWDEPLENEKRVIEHDSLNLTVPQIGEIVELKNPLPE